MSYYVISSFRRPGGSLIVIRGHHHLRQCAYIGDNSSEEEEELQELKEKKYSIPKYMTRLRPDVRVANSSGLGEEYLITKELDLNENEFDFRMHQEHRETLQKVQRPDAKPIADSLPSEEVFKTALRKLKLYETQGKKVLGEVAKRLGNEGDSKLLMSALQKSRERQRRQISLLQQLNVHDEDDNNAQEEVLIIFFVLIFFVIY